MPVRYLDIPTASYCRLIDGGSLHPSDHELLAKVAAEYADVHVFGTSVTGQLMKSVLGDRFVSFINSDTLDPSDRVDYRCIMVATSPVHYDDVLSILKRKCPKSDPVIIFPFVNAFENPVRVILETQPRSGTGYVIKSLRDSGRLSYATVFEGEKGEFSGKCIKKNGVCFDFDGTDRQYFVKSHFYDTVPCPEYHRKAPTVRLISYIMDAYFLWGRMLAYPGVAYRDTQYRLVEWSPEWQTLKRHIYTNRQWLSSLGHAPFFRYEDFALDFSCAVSAFCQAINLDCQAHFPEFRIPSYRTYFTDDYLAHMDPGVFLFLWQEFAETIEKTHPEKIPAIRRTLASIGGQCHVP